MKSCDNGERTQRPFICVMPKAHINTCITLQSGSLQLHKRTFIYEGGNIKGSFCCFASVNEPFIFEALFELIEGESDMPCPCYIPHPQVSYLSLNKSLINIYTNDA